MEIQRGVVRGKCFSILHLDGKQKAKLDILISNFFDKMSPTLGCAAGVEHVIDTGEHPPIKQRFYNVSPYTKKIIHDEIDHMLELGVIEPSYSAWSSSVVMVRKCSGEYRFCVDFCKVNSVMRRDTYPCRMSTVFSIG